MWGGGGDAVSALTIVGIIVDIPVAVSDVPVVHGGQFHNSAHRLERLRVGPQAADELDNQPVTDLTKEVGNVPSNPLSSAKESDLGDELLLAQPYSVDEPLEVGTKAR